MAAQIALRPDGEKISYTSAGVSTTVRLTHNIVGEEDRDVAKADYLTFLNAAEDGLPLQDYDIQPNAGSATTWIGNVTYSSSGKKTENQILNGGGIIERFVVNSRTVRILASESTNKFPNVAATPDFKRLINVNNDGTVQGVDIEFAELGVTVTKQYTAATVTSAFKAKLQEAMNRVNSVIFRDYAIGTMRLRSVSDQDAGSDNINITYEFLSLENRTGFTIGDITNIDKKGHEYLWVRYKQDRDATAKVIKKIPQFVYVEKVYLDFDFNDALFGIG